MQAESLRKVIAVIHGPNLDALGTREVDVYGAQTLSDIDTALRALGERLHCDVMTEQHAGEGAIVDAIHRAGRSAAAILLNAGAYSHYSYAIRDALAAVSIPKVEVHLTNIFGREQFRRRSVLAPVVDGFVGGFGSGSYLLALRGAAALIDGGNA